MSDSVITATENQNKQREDGLGWQLTTDWYYKQKTLSVTLQTPSQTDGQCAIWGIIIMCHK